MLFHAAFYKLTYVRMTAEALGYSEISSVIHDGQGRLASYTTFDVSYASVVLQSRHTNDVIPCTGIAPAQLSILTYFVP